ncbi:MAG: hypothetical protein V4671_15840 [Armatimonadota bacterium]
MGKYRKYTDQERGEALAFVDACNGNYKQASQMLDIPWTTLREWHQGNGVAEPEANFRSIATLFDLFAVFVLATFCLLAGLFSGRLGMIFFRALCCAFIFGLLFLVASPASAQVKAGTSKAAPVTKPARDVVPDTEVAVLRAQLQTMKDYDGRLLGTVYWSLAGMFSVIFVVLGAGYFINFRSYERDREAIKDSILNEVRAELVAQHATEKAEIDLFHANAEKMIDTGLSEIPAKLEESSKKAVAGVEESSKKAVAGVEQSSKKAVADIERKIEVMQSDVNDMKFDLLKIEAVRWRETGVFNNALRTECETIQFLKQVKRDYWLGQRVENIKSDLNRLIKDKARLSTGVSGNIMEALNGMPAELSIEVEIVKQLISRASTPDGLSVATTAGTPTP